MLIKYLILFFNETDLYVTNTPKKYTVQTFSYNSDDRDAFQNVLTYYDITENDTFFLGIINIESICYKIYGSNSKNYNNNSKNYNNSIDIPVDFKKLDISNTSTILYRLLKLYKLSNFDPEIIKKNANNYKFINNKALIDYPINEPYYYHLNKPGKNIRLKYIDELLNYFTVDKTIISNIKHCTAVSHDVSLLIDDIQDTSLLRRGTTCAYLKYGSPMTIASAYNVCFHLLNNINILLPTYTDTARTLIINSIAILHEGQSKDIFWRDNKICPTFNEYIDMIKKKTCQAFILITQLIFLYIEDIKIKLYNYFINFINKLIDLLTPIIKLTKIKTLEEIFIEIITDLGIYFQINDDYINLTSKEYSKKKGLYDDIYEKKFSFIIVDIVANKKKGYAEIIQLFEKEKLTQEDVEKCITLILNTDSIQYTKNYLEKLKLSILKKSSGYLDVKWFLIY